jgi:hypothetical protein
VRIQFRSEGGFAHFPGLSKPMIVDTASLPAADAAELEQLVHEARFFTRPVQIGGPGAGGADYRTYTISVESAGQSHTIRVIEPVGDSSLQALIDGLRARQRGPA